MKKMIKIAAVAVVMCFANSAFATKIEVIGFYIESSSSTTPDGSHTTVSITCGLVSTDVCYTVDKPDRSRIEPRRQNGELNEEDYYSAVLIPNGEIYEGKFFAHYQHTEQGQTGLNSVHTLMYR